MYIFLDQPDSAAYMILVALFMDFLDGFVARMLKVSSPVGKELDSLADMVSFGVVPAMILVRMIENSQGVSFPGLEIWSVDNWSLLGLLVAVFSALRLAKFNLDDRQSDAFYGLPTPANTILILSLWLIVSYWPEHWMANLINHPKVLLGIGIFSCYILVAEVKLIALKFKDFSLKGNLARFLLLGISLLFLAIFQVIGIPYIIVAYLLLSALDNMGVFGKK